MIVVSDTSPILNLARIGRLELLIDLYHQVLIPSSVYEELSRNQGEISSAVNLFSAPWLTIANASDRLRVEDLRRNLDEGEAEAIALAIERQADLLLIDERRGRLAAAKSGLKIIGLLGVVAAAKHAGLITKAKPLLDDLIQVARFWIGPQLYAEALAQLDE